MVVIKFPLILKGLSNHGYIFSKTQLRNFKIYIVVVNCFILL